MVRGCYSPLQTVSFDEMLGSWSGSLAVKHTDHDNDDSWSVKITVWYRSVVFICPELCCTAVAGGRGSHNKTTAASKD